MRPFASATPKGEAYWKQEPHYMTPSIVCMLVNEQEKNEPVASSQWDFTRAEHSFPYIGAISWQPGN
tara:strand:- start:735 stop:935 length:201 start_codon:yes stop_codon:yes gene_type:complete